MAYTISHCFRPSSQRSLCVGISKYVIEKNSKFMSGFSGRASWFGEMNIPKYFAKRYPITKFKSKKDGKPFDVYVIPIDDIKDFNNARLNDEPKIKTIERQIIDKELDYALAENALLKEVMNMFPDSQLLITEEVK